MDITFNARTPLQHKENGILVNDESTTFAGMFKRKKTGLRLGKKIYEFYAAPITKFWAHTVSHTQK